MRAEAEWCAGLLKYSEGPDRGSVAEKKRERERDVDMLADQGKATALDGDA